MTLRSLNTLMLKSLMAFLNINNFTGYKYPKKICNTTLIVLLLIAGPVGWVFAGNIAIENPNAGSILPLSDKGYSLVINNETFSLGDKWDALRKYQAGKELSNSYVGDVEVNATSYKFYQHNYEGYTIYSSNIYYDKQNRDVDEYVISQISLDDLSIKTSRGIVIGDPLSAVVKSYGAGKEDDSDNERWIYYDFNNKSLSFKIEQGKVASIMMAISTDD